LITLYTWTTPNGRKVPIMLEEIGLPYEVHAVNLGENEQFDPNFLRISPNNKIPAIVDDDAKGGPLTIFESGAILTYLAEKTGKLLPASGPGRYKVLEWTYWQVGGLGPMLGQLGYFAKRAEKKNPPAVDRFTEEAGRLFGVMERRLSEAEYLGGKDYSIADVATYPWMRAATEFLGDVVADSLGDKPGIDRWMAAVGARPAVKKGMTIPKVP
jgi:GST-like protein